MSKRFSLLAAALLIFSAVALVAAQTPTQTQTTTTTVTKTVQNEDGTYTVIEYPIGKEVKINLTLKSEVSLADFGLLITMEDATGSSVSPLGPSIGIVEIVP